MMRHGIPVGPMIFIPFMGAAVEMKEKPKTPYIDAYVSLAGPIVGTAAAMVPLAYGMQTGSNLAFALADVGMFLNLFNLAPIGMLDGGRVAPIIHPSLIYMGFGAGCLYMFYSPSFHPVFTIVMLSGAYQVYTRVMGTAEDLPDISKMPPEEYYTVAGAYFGLIAFLCYMLYLTGAKKKDVAQMKLEAKPVRFFVDKDGDVCVHVTTMHIVESRRGQIMDEINVNKQLKVLKAHEEVEGLVYDYPIRKGGTHNLAPGTEMIFTKGGRIVVQEPDGMKTDGFDPDRWYSMVSDVATCFNVPSECIEIIESESLDGKVVLKVNMDRLKLEAMDSYEFLDTSIFRVHLDAVSKYNRARREWNNNQAVQQKQQQQQ
eukprot:CAMPEP_0170173368 /NCGR_PEP_ID=MMETSP0040_2-20121228/6652_1 /TAXON_ID=641309 /ORGANISM="Lotharella oceanica, Strain CCMP622" /LENGTH=371 /DNA_ID=CAMNT_0010414521 /DNA_START=494 /DNA_END=1609 /DNA_ORIENTATION=-